MGRQGHQRQIAQLHVRVFGAYRTVGRVRLLRIVPERYRNLLRELLAFGFAGAVNTGLGFLIFNLLLGMGSLTANAISTACATASSFTLNRHVTYRHRPRTKLRRELPLFVFFNLIGLGLQQVIMGGGKWAFGLAETDRLELNMVRVAAVVVGTVFLLLTYRTFVFKKAPAPEMAGAPMGDAPAGGAMAAAPLDILMGSGSETPDHHSETSDDHLVEASEFADLTDPLEAEYTLGELLESELRNRTTEEIDAPAARPVR